MVLNASDNVKDYFKHASLTPIPGQPNYKTLAQLQKEVHANSQSVPCSLRGGNLGHIMVLLHPSPHMTILTPRPHLTAWMII